MGHQPELIPGHNFSLNMRLKIQSVPPLPVVRVWFTPGADLLDISDLSATLAREVFAPKSKNASPPLNLSLDGFELLEASLLSDVLRDGDLVVVKAVDVPKKTPGTRFVFRFGVSG